jgi:hypothetical protein
MNHKGLFRILSVDGEDVVTCGVSRYHFNAVKDVEQRMTAADFTLELGGQGRRTINRDNLPAHAFHLAFTRTMD